ncbi:TlpA family protein disulfide reductase [Flagellimonas flava]|uniref:TlpA family protein disulfide reductase n=1 Tax=Flagellimonas flava TaxID=570519 RepID=UPI003D65437B
MRSIIPILLAIFMASCAQKEVKKEYAIVSGKLSNSDIESVRLISINGDFNKEIPVSDEGQFLDTLFLTADMPHRLTDGINHIVLYLEKGYAVHLDYNPRDFANTIQFEGDGADLNRYYLQKQDKNREIEGMDFKTFYGLKEPAFVKKVEELNLAINGLLDSTVNIPEYVREKEKRAIDHYSIIQLAQYKDFAHADVTANPNFTVSENFEDERSSMPFLNKEDFDYSVFYNSLVHLHYKEQIKQRAQKDSLVDPNEVFFQVVGEIPVENIKNSVLYRTVWGSMPYIQNVDSYYEKFMSLSTNETHKQEITDAYNRIKKIKPGANSPTFEAYENHAGGHSSLEDFQGKYVYIDVWASWCAPCIQEIPDLKEVEKKYRGKNIEFLSISVDTDRSYDDWKKMVVDKELTGVQLIADKAWDSEFIKDYQIKGIPRYILIDPEGKIVNAMAPSPSTDALETTLEGLGL